MNQSDHLSNDVSVEGRLTETGLTVKTRSRAIAALDRLIGSIADVPAAKLEAYASRIRTQSRLETNIIDHVSIEQIGAIIGNNEDAARLVNELLAPKIQALANKKFVAQLAINHLTSTDSGGKPEPEPEPELELEPGSVQDEVDPDWLNYFDGYAEKASSDAVRDLWARVLAGEIRHPKSFSLMTLRVLAELDQQMASWFQEETEFRISGEFILPPSDWKGESLERLGFLEEAGLLHHIAPTGGLVRLLKPDANGLATFFEGDLCLRIKIQNEIKLPVIYLTHVGKEIATILPPVDPISVFRKITAVLPSDIKSVHICQILSEHQDYVKVSEPIQVLRSEDPSA